MNKKKLKTFAICLLLSFGMWILNKTTLFDEKDKEEKSYECTTKYQNYKYEDIKCMIDSIYP